MVADEDIVNFFIFRAIAFALNCSMNKLAEMGLRLEDFDYGDAHIYREIHACMNKTTFVGVSVS